jgi:hypothetical protein
MKCSAHKIAVASACGSNVKVHRTGYGVMLGEISVGDRLNRSERIALIA